MQLSQDDATMILLMHSACDGEDIGPDSSVLVKRIYDSYPELRARFNTIFNNSKRFYPEAWK